MADDRSAKKLRKIHLLCLEFAETLKNLPFANKTDEAKARSFLSGIREVLQAHTIKLEVSPPKKAPSWKPKKATHIDREVGKAGLKEARRRLIEGNDDDG